VDDVLEVDGRRVKSGRLLIRKRNRRESLRKSCEEKVDDFHGTVRKVRGVAWLSQLKPLRGCLS
jgi:hypothetical protein